VLEKLIVVDYQEGSGGEFVASWLSAHFGHLLVENPQKNPDYYQKWLNSHSLITSNWNENFSKFFLDFVTRCCDLGITQIAVPYHLYKWPHHVDIIKDCCPHARFVRINCKEYQREVSAEFDRKVRFKKLGPKDFATVKFMLTQKSSKEIQRVLTLFKKQELVFQDLMPNIKKTSRLKILPSQDIEINFRDFFVDFDQTKVAYNRLCDELALSPDNTLLGMLIERNKKNWQDLQNYLSIT
jgi:hypothetical protein